MIRSTGVEKRGFDADVVDRAFGVVGLAERVVAFVGPLHMLVTDEVVLYSADLGVGEETGHRHIPAVSVLAHLIARQHVSNPRIGRHVICTIGVRTANGKRRAQMRDISRNIRGGQGGRIGSESGNGSEWLESYHTAFCTLVMAFSFALRIPKGTWTDGMVSAADSRCGIWSSK